jgi:hypothetical protein
MVRQPRLAGTEGCGMNNVISLATARRLRRNKAKLPHPADDLSFMKRRKPRGTGIDYWLINPTDDSSADCETGRKLAEEYLAYIGEHPTYGNATLLTCIVHEMIERARDGQKWSGIHVGFLRVVNDHAMAIARALRVDRG